MKNLLTLVLVLCLGTFASAQIPSYVPTNGLVGWWPFNGNANDESGNGNHGTVNGAISIADHLNNPGSAFLFGNGRSISVPMSNSLFQMPQRTFVCRFKANGNQSGGRIYETTFRNSGIGMYSGNLLDTWYGYSQHCCNIVGMNGGSLGIWHHLVSIANDITGLTQVYLDGNLLSQSNGYPAGGGCFSNTAWQWQGEFINFGLGASGESFIGEIDDIAIYNRALSPAEVQQLYLGNCTQPTFTVQPQNTSVAQGQITTFAVQVDTTSTFQWQMNLGLGAGWANIPQSSLFSGDTTATLSVQGRNPLDGAQFRCIATACQSDTSNAATLTVTSNSTTLGSVAGVPGKINYQGAAVDSAGKPMKNQTIALKLSVLDSSSSGAAAYVETHSTPTNGSGLFSLQIGGGTAVTGTFDSIPWANGRNKYLKTEVNQNGTWVNLGTSQLVSVPYALHAGSASYASQAGTLRDSLGNAYQIKSVNGQPTLVSAPGNVSSPAPFACGQAVTYAGESYPTVQIGTQCWFAKNLNVGTFTGSWNNFNNQMINKQCYENLLSNCDTFGGLYSWYQLLLNEPSIRSNSYGSPEKLGYYQGICPSGWHIPSAEEFGVLKLAVPNFDTLFINFSKPFGGLRVGGVNGPEFFWKNQFSIYYLSSSIKWGTDPWCIGAGGTGLGYILSGYADGLSARCVLDQGVWKHNPQLISNDTLWINEYDDNYTFSIVGNTDSSGLSCYRWIDQEWDNVSWPYYSDSSLTSYLDTSIGIYRRLFYCRYSSNGVEFDSIIVTKNPKKTFACGDTISYLNENYPSISIGNQCWLTKNLNIGDIIVNSQDQSKNSIFEKYCYNNDPVYCDTFGGLYQWAEAVQYKNGASNSTSPNQAYSGNLRGICPRGWHLPRDSEWCTLTTLFDSASNCQVIGNSSFIAGNSLKSTLFWQGLSGNNSSGFNGLPGGARDSIPTGGFIGGYQFGLFWTLEDNSNILALARTLNYNTQIVNRLTYNKTYGFSIRCLKD